MSDLERLQLIQAGARAEMDRTMRELHKQKEEAAQLRRENKALRNTLRIQNMSATRSTHALTSSASSGSTFSNADPATDIQRKEVQSLQQQVFVLKGKLDETRDAVARKQKQYEDLLEKNRELNSEREPLLSATNPLNTKVHMLENRLDKSMVKYNEAMNIRRTYEAIVRKLQQERVTYDKQLASIEKNLHTKENDLKELNNMSRDATNARDIAKAELAQFKLTLEEERKKRQKDLDERQSMVQARKERLKVVKKVEPKQHVEQVRKETEDEARTRVAEEQRREEERARLAQYASDFKRIREVTGADTAEEVIMKFIAQQDTSETLAEMSKDAQAKLEALTAERAELRVRLEDALFRGSGHIGSRRILDEFRTHLSEAKVQVARVRSEYEDLAASLVNVRAGVAHLVDTLAPYHTELTTAATVDADPVEVLRFVGRKLEVLADEAAGLTEEELVGLGSVPASSSSAPENLTTPTLPGGTMPRSNLRVKLTEREDEDAAPVEEEEEGDEDVYDRERVKKFAQIAVLRETKRRNKKKKGTEE